MIFKVLYVIWNLLIGLRREWFNNNKIKRILVYEMQYKLIFIFKILIYLVNKIVLYFNLYLVNFIRFYFIYLKYLVMYIYLINGNIICIKKNLVVIE